MAKDKEEAARIARQKKEAARENEEAARVAKQNYITIIIIHSYLRKRPHQWRERPHEWRERMKRPHEWRKKTI